MTFGKQFWRPLTAVVLGALISSSALAQSVVTRLVVASGAATSTKIVPGGSTSMDVRLDIVTASIFGTGFTLSQTAPGTSGFFSITGRSFVGSPFNDTTSGTPDATVLAPASALLNPANNDNLGRTTIGFVGHSACERCLGGQPDADGECRDAARHLHDPPDGRAVVRDGHPFNDYEMSTGTPFTIIVGQTLTVTKSGTGTGTVTANSGAINCGATCSDIYPGTVGHADPDACRRFGVRRLERRLYRHRRLRGDDERGPVGERRVQPADICVDDDEVRHRDRHASPARRPASTAARLAPSASTSGTSVTLTPTPAAGSVFAGWSGACTGTGACVVTMNAAQSVSAVFNLQTFALTTTKSGTGTGTVTSAPAGINCGATCTFSFNVGHLGHADPDACCRLGVRRLERRLHRDRRLRGDDERRQVGERRVHLQTFALTTTKSGTGTGTVTSSPAGINCGATCTVQLQFGHLGHADPDACRRLGVRRLERRLHRDRRLRGDDERGQDGERRVHRADVRA